MDLSQQEFHANMRGGPPPSQSWHTEEPDSSGYYLHPRVNAHRFSKSDGRPRMRSTINGPGFPPTPKYFPEDPIYPPGFDSSQMYPPGFDKRRNFPDEMIFEESLEVTSVRPFLPQRRAPSGERNTSRAFDEVSRGNNQGSRFESRVPSQSSQTNILVFETNELDASEGGPRVLLSHDGNIRKRKKTGVEDVQAAHADIINLRSSFEKAQPSSIRSSVIGGPFVPRTVGATAQKSASACDKYDKATKLCLKLWKDLDFAMKQREKTLRANEQNFSVSDVNKEALEEEKKLAAAMKVEVTEQRQRLEEEAQKIRTEKDALERISTDIALQMVELKQIQKQIGKEKAALLALKSESSGKKGRSKEPECVTTTGNIPLCVVKAESVGPASYVNTTCFNNTNCDLQSCATPSNLRVEEPRTTEALAVVMNSNMTSMRAGPGTSEGVTVQSYTSKLEENSSEDDMDDVPLATRLRSQRVEKTKQREDLESSTRKVLIQKKESQFLGGNSLVNDFHMKRNKVAIEFALQEDAPGLLEQLEERGLLEDMGIYEDMTVDNLLTTESPASEFGKLERVVGKLWGPTSGLAKDLIPLKGQGSGNMPRYCLACLSSLIEQTRSLRKRNWPVEWGWCRRLRSFLFVFEKHNRIVLERPEYGYATYFFELVQSLPVKWQTQRLIAVMSVASTGRAALLENRQLVVGVDLTDDEGAILEEYGWKCSSGLGSLLNFCDRVVHDYSKGQDLGNDWKHKIGKLLMDGYDQGSIVGSSVQCTKFRTAHLSSENPGKFSRSHRSMRRVCRESLWRFTTFRFGSLQAQLG
ncbi:uncharacterized protein [Physcomitrium patens]|uniref:uncharacterized protein isoform X3 n=1 Tax=Physcomitrium patens TaxID=3218 RepID=UPI000D1655B8|nr:uncharacterized protein LOC112276693 isoform X3 [Physcomitrium patens]|eukprot:XP_024364024.1 uncharacterized protein LOC112276693 isoform X3 [Physcomitrella patens]